MNRSYPQGALNRLRLPVLSLAALTTAALITIGQETANLVSAVRLADLRALPPPRKATEALVQGYHAPGDSGGGRFYWDAAAKDPDDGGIWIVPSANPSTGRWKRIAERDVNAKWFGAVGDGVNADTSRIQAALDYVAAHGGGRVYLPAGQYLLEAGSDSVLKLGSNTSLYGAGAATQIISLGPQAIRNKDSDDPQNYGNENLSVQNLVINCRGQGVNGIVFGSVTDSSISGVRIMDPLGYGIWLYRLGDSIEGEGKPTKRVTVMNCHITGIQDVGIECSGAVGCVVSGNTVTGTSGIGAYYAWNGATDCVFVGNIAEGEGLSNTFTGLAVQPAEAAPGAPRTQTQRISFIGNIVRNVSRGVYSTGSPDNRPTDILVQGTLFSGLKTTAGRGAEIENSVRVRIKDNHFEGFLHPLVMNDVSAGFPSNGAGFVSIEGNTVRGGQRCVLIGNVAGSLSDNTFLDQDLNPIVLFGWRHCRVSNNTFVNAGKDQYAVAIVVEAYGNQAAEGNDFSGNRILDEGRDARMIGTVVFNSGNHSMNAVARNSAAGGHPLAVAFYSLGVGTNNIIYNNINR